MRRHLYVHQRGRRAAVVQQIVVALWLAYLYAEQQKESRQRQRLEFHKRLGRFPRISGGSPGVLRICGFENGDTSEANSLVGTPVIDSASTQNVGSTGFYSLRNAASGAAGGVRFTGLNSSSIYAGMALYTNLVLSAGTGISNCMRFETSTGTVLARVSLRVVPSGSPLLSLQLANNAGTQIGSNIAITANQRIWIELQQVISATVGVYELRVNGVVVATASAQNTGTTNIDRVLVGIANAYSNWSSGSAWFDDVIIRDDQYSGPVYVIARQGVAGTPTYDAWTKNGAATAALCWSNTPFTTGTNCSNAVLNNVQTMLIGSFGSAGSAQEGTGTILSIDTIVAAKTAIIAKASIGGTNTSIRRRVGGVDTSTGITTTTADKYFDDGIWTPTFTNLTDGTLEAGAVDTLGALTDTVEDVWVHVAYSPGGPAAPKHPQKKRLPIVTRKRRPSFDRYASAIFGTVPRLEPPALARRQPKRRLARLRHRIIEEGALFGVLPQFLLHRRQPGRPRPRPRRRLHALFEETFLLAMVPRLLRPKLKARRVARHLHEPAQPSAGQAVVFWAVSPREIQTHRQQLYRQPPKRPAHFKALRSALQVVLDAIVNWRERGGW